MSIDEIELAIRNEYPEMKHIYIEAKRLCAQARAKAAREAEP